MLLLHRSLFASLLIATGPLTLGQDTITSGMLTFVPGEEFTTTFCDPVGHGSAGAAQTWEFGTLPDCATPRTEVWGEPSGLTDLEYTVSHRYPPSSIVELYLGTADAFQMVVDAPFPNETYGYTDPRDIVRYPMAFGDSYTDTFNGSRSVGNIEIETFEGNRTVTYDAYGTLVLPWGTLTDVFRLRSQDTMRYSNSTYFDRVVVEHLYFRPGMHQYLLRVRENTSLVSGTTSHSSSLYLSGSAGMADLAAEQDVALYPDPVAGQAMLRTNARPRAVEAFDLSGRSVILPFVPESGGIRIDASALASGVYTLVLTGPDGRMGRRFVKE